MSFIDFIFPGFPKWCTIFWQ